MRLRSARIDTTTPEEWDADTTAMMAGISDDVPAANIFTTLARHPKLLKRWMVFANHVLAKSTLPARERELAILRVGYRCESGYEWTQHVAIGRAAGVTDDEIRALAVDDLAGGPWSPADRTLLAAVDQLVATHFVDDDTWSALTETWDEQQLMDLVFAVGQYTLVSMALNTLGVQLEPDAVRFPPELYTDDDRFLPS